MESTSSTKRVISKEQKEEYIKFLKKNVTNAFALEKEKKIN